MKNTTDVKRNTGADLRAMAEARMSAQAGPAAEASRRADVIRAGLTNYSATMDKIAEAYQRQDWKTLGYDSFTSYAAGEFGETRLKLSPEHRAQILPAFVAVGMPKRAIAAALGVDEKTVRNDLRGAENSAPSLEDAQVKKDSGGVGGEDADVSGQAAAEAVLDIPATADGGEGHAFRPHDPSAGDGSGRSGSVPGNPQDAPAASASPSDQSALVAQQSGSEPSVAPGGPEILLPPAVVEDGEALPAGPSSTLQELTEEQAPTSPVEPVLSLSGAGVSPDGDEVEEESEASTEDSSSTDPAAEFVAFVEGFAERLALADPDVIGPLLSEEQLGRIDRVADEVGYMAGLLRRWRES